MPWARSFCPFRARVLQELLSFQSESLAGAFELSAHLEPLAKVLL